jgi:hypothetical protein
MFAYGSCRKRGKEKSPRSKERGTSQVELTSNLYIITHRCILKHGLEGGGPSISDEHKGGRWKQIYGIPFHLFLVLSSQFEDWLKAKNKTIYQKKDMHFQLHAIACFHQLCLGGPMHQYREGYGMVTIVFRYFFFSFLDWLWGIKSNYVYLPKTKEDINHVEDFPADWLSWMPWEHILCSRSVAKVHMDITNGHSSNIGAPSWHFVGCKQEPHSLMTCPSKEDKQYDVS